MSETHISVILCTHNPRPDYIQRTLASLKIQTLPKEQWEFLFVDNACQEQLSKTWDVSWHPHSRHIREEELGLTPARLCGIKNSKGKLLIFIDDDNILNSDYLEKCSEVGGTFPFLGVWGGQQVGEFEIEVTDWIKPFLSNLACRRVEKVAWANLPFCYEATPVGAGMCIRREIAIKYISAANSSRISKKLDRVGNQLTSCGDHDLAFTACDGGLGMGVFPDLKLTHLIPKERMQKDYILRLIEGDVYSATLLKHRREFQLPQESKINFRQKVRRMIRLLMGDFNTQVQIARERGLKKALTEIYRSIN